MEDFQLERWLATNPCQYNLGGALNYPLKLSDIISEIDLDMEIVYGNTQGSSELRTLISQLFNGVNEEMVLVTSGTAEANFILLNSVIREGDEFVMFLPTYMQMAGLASALGADVKICYLREENNFRPDFDSLERIVSRKTRAIHITNPNNPTGSKFPLEDLKTICTIADKVGAHVIADEALRGLEVDGIPLSSPVEVYDMGLVTGSLSKLGLSGMRLGWIVGERELIERCWAFKDYTTLSHSGISELLAEKALRRENMKRFEIKAQEVIRDHLEIFEAWMNEHDDILSWVKPIAGNTAFPRYNLDIDSTRFCVDLLKEESVLISPGDYFGASNHLRIRYGCTKETLIEALSRIGDYLGRFR
jgi:aspartate/methionine/tyrosine aminotransferase